jgi:hypothetical protein
MLTTIEASGELFHTAAGTAFTDLPIDGQGETWPLRGKRFQAWLRQRYYGPGMRQAPAALNAALNALEAQAQFDGAQCKVSLRLAELDADPMAADRIVGPPNRCPAGQRGRLLYL